MSALASLWPESGIPLSVTAAAFAQPGARDAAVAVTLRAQAPLSSDTAGEASSQRARIAVLAGAYDTEGKALSQQVHDVAVTPPSGATRRFEFEVVSRLQLAPGRHEIRVAAEDRTHGLRGSVYTYVDVPDFARADLSLSGIVLGTLPAKPANGWEDLLPVTPTAQRQFTAARDVAAFVRIYTRDKRHAPVTMRVRIENERGDVAFAQPAAPVDMGLGAPASGDFVFSLPLSTLPHGEYLLTLEAGSGKTTIRRDVRLGVR